MNHLVPQRLALLCLLLAFACRAQAQGDSTSTADTAHPALRVFLDCGLCDKDYVQENVAFVTYVRLRENADVHVLVSTQKMGNGGDEYTLGFIGVGGFAGLNDTLSFTTLRTDTQEDVRRQLAKTLKLGLVRYVAHRWQGKDLSISYTAPTKKEAVADPWDSWVFSISVDGNTNGEQTSRYSYVSQTFSANRVTKDLKLSFSGRWSYNENNYDYTDYQYTSISRSASLNGKAIFSISDHWSYGFFGSGYRSDYSNTEFSISLAPALEYDIFPYSESTRRQLRLEYQPSLAVTHYKALTIYDKMHETLGQESLSLTLSQKEEWGTTSVSLNASHYFKGIKYYNVGVFGSVSLRVNGGLSLNIFGDYSLPHDQLALEKGTASDEEVLLQRRELETAYRYFVSVGISYSFGSMFNTIVNPRFGSSSGGGTTIMYTSD